MDLKSLRPTHSQWRAPLDTPAERRAATLQKPQVQTAAKTLLQPPKGKGGPLWQKFYDDAVARKHADPEKLADTLLRSRERALELAEARHKTVLVLAGPVKPQETCAVNTGPSKKAKAVVHEALRCKARTLAGKQCGFKATCGEFCKKHAVTPTWRAVSVAARFAGQTSKGQFQIDLKRVVTVFGAPPEGGEWRVEFDDETLASFRWADGILHVSAHTVGAVAKVREALA
jgi:hypothetical protein